MRFTRISIAALTAAALLFSGIASAADNFTILPEITDAAISDLPYDEIFPANSGFIVKQDNCYGLLDANGKLVLSPEWAAITPGKEAILLLDVQGKYGFADWAGKQIIPSTYDFAAPFSDGFAKVQQNGKYSYIDKTGKLLIPWQDHEIQTADGEYFTYRENGKSTVLDNQGNIILQPHYENMLLFRDGVAAAMQSDGWYGLITITGEEILPFQYRELRYIGNGLYLALKDNKQGYINTQGQPVGRMIWEPSAHGPVIGNLLAAEGGGKLGFMNQNGKMVQELQYQDVIPSPDHSGPMFVLKDGKYGLLDGNGKQLQKPELILDNGSISGYVNSYATVRKNGYEGLLDAKGNLVVRPEYQQATAIGNFFYLRDDTGSVIARPNAVLQPLSTDILTAPITADKVQSIVDAGIMTGDPDGNLLLDAAVTRAQFVTMLARMEQWDLSEPTNTVFTDVPDGHWAQAAISQAAERGLVNGVGDGMFQPDGAITTQQIFTILVRLAGKETDAQAIIASGGNGYADVAWELGIGTTEIGWALPTPATRELTACFLYDYLQ